MKSILETAIDIKKREPCICTRCLGRLFGKVGYNLDNPTRGKIIEFILELFNIINNDQGLPTGVKDGKCVKSVKNVKCVNATKSKKGKKNDINLTGFLDALKFFSFQNPLMEPITNIMGINFEPKHDKKVIDTPETKELEQRYAEEFNKMFNTPGFKKLIKQSLTHSDNTSILDNRSTLVSTESCIICEGLFDELDHFSSLVLKRINEYEFSDFLIGCRIDDDIQSNEERIWSEYGIENGEPIKAEFNRELGKHLGEKLGKWVNFNTPDITIVIDTRYDTITLQIASLFIYGRYRKLVRDTPQTRWPCKRCWGSGCKNCNGTGKLYQTSVEEEIAMKVMELTKGKAHYFHGMGREDIGVKMLGNGRPFILEITEPVFRNLDLKNVEHEINAHACGKVEVFNLVYTTHHAVRELKAEKPNKTYLVKINFPIKVDDHKLQGAISALNGTTIKQRTPTRVAHRRANLIRNRKVVKIELLNLLNNGMGAEIKIEGESGLYIKELITGDS